MKYYIATIVDEVDGAILIVSNESRGKLKYLASQFFCYNFFDIRLRLCEDHVKKIVPRLKDNKTRLFDNLPYCKNCDFWGAGVENNRCGNCGEYPGDHLVRLYEEN